MELMHPAAGQFSVSRTVVQRSRIELFSPADHAPHRQLLGRDMQLSGQALIQFAASQDNTELSALMVRTAIMRHVSCVCHGRSRGSAWLGVSANRFANCAKVLLRQ